MKKQKGSAAIVALAVLAIVFVLVVLAVMVFINANNTANRFEQSIIAQHGNNRNVLSQYNQKVLEVAQVPAMMRDDLIKVATATMEGRYGADGSKAMFQMLKEQNPSMDASLYTKIQQIVESGRDEFKTNQSRLLDIKSSYGKALGNFPGGPLMSILGYPKIDLAKYDIVTTEGVEQSFKAGKEAAPIKLRPAE